MNSMTRPKLHKHDKHAYKPISTIYLFFFLSILEESRHYPQNAELGQAWQSIAIDMTRTSKTLP